MKTCKYNNFEIRFTKEETDLRIKYDLLIFQSGDIRLMEKCKHQIIFHSNEKNIYLGNYEKYIVATKNTTEINLLWTSFKGNPEIFSIKSYDSFYDYLIMNFARQKQKILYVGEDYRMAKAAWRNSVNLDLFSTFFATDLDIISGTFLKETAEQYLPF